MTGDTEPERFRRLFAASERDLLAYALRRVERPEDAADVVAETFLIAWRRLGDVPPGEEARLWLYGVARRVLANQRRGQLRRSRLADRLRGELPAAVQAVGGPESGEDAGEARAVLRALATLGEDDREVLLLSGWEELTPEQVARVLRISRVAARSRLHRARRRLHTALESGAVPAAALPATRLEEAR